MPRTTACAGCHVGGGHQPFGGLAGHLPERVFRRCAALVQGRAQVHAVVRQVGALHRQLVGAGRALQQRARRPCSHAAGAGSSSTGSSASPCRPGRASAQAPPALPWPAPVGSTSPASRPVPASRCPARWRRSPQAVDEFADQEAGRDGRPAQQRQDAQSATARAASTAASGRRPPADRPARRPAARPPPCCRSRAAWSRARPALPPWALRAARSAAGWARGHGRGGCGCLAIQGGLQPCQRLRVAPIQLGDRGEEGGRVGIILALPGRFSPAPTGPGAR